jgi:AAA domain-containing protein
VIHPTNNFFEDESYQDQLTKLLVESTVALKQCLPLLDINDFKPKSGMRWGNPRWLVTELALVYGRQNKRRIGKLIRSEVLDYCKKTGLSKTQLQQALDYLKHLKAMEPPVAAPIIEKIQRWKQQIRQDEVLEEMNRLQGDGELDPAKWWELSQRVLAMKRSAEPVHSESAATLLTAVFEQPRYVYNSILPAGELVMVSGKKNSGKTTLGMQTAISVVRQEPLFGRGLRTKGGALFLGYEETRVEIRHKLERLCNEDTDSLSSLEFLHAFNDAGDVVIPKLDKGGLDLVRTKLEAGQQGKPYALCIIDHLTAAFSAQTGRDIVREAYAQLDPLRRLAIATGTTIVILHHNRKADSSEFLDDPAGSVGVTAGAGAIWVLRNVPSDSTHRLLHITGRRTKERRLKLKLLKSGFELIAEGARATVGPAGEKILSLLSQQGAMSPKEIAAALSLKANNVHQLLLRLRSRSLVNIAEGKYNVLGGKHVSS